jgi:hypothetical protein
MDLVNQIASVNLDVREENMEYVNTDDVGVILHHLQRLRKKLNCNYLVHQMDNVNLDVRVEELEYVITENVRAWFRHF